MTLLSFIALQGFPPQPNRDGVPTWYPHELEEARRVQLHLFPRELPELPGWDLGAACRSARVVSGDYYDVFPLGPGRVALALGDVAGKGLGPALVMAGLRAFLHSRLPGGADDLAALLRELNAYLLATTPDEMFVTLFVAVLDLPTGRLRYANAGHLPPFVLTGGEPLPVTGSGPVLGIIPDADYVEGQVGLKPGSLLALFSDGLTEASNEAGWMFHQRRVVELLRATWGRSAQQTLAHLLEAVETFRGKSAPTDDLSVILLRRLAADNTEP
jgi:sigma-B regulation protein RsbU (phosphoserine phosphatase)